MPHPNLQRRRSEASQQQVAPLPAAKPRATLSAAAFPGLVVLCCLLVMIVGFQLWRADLRVPFSYAGDAIWSCALIEGLIESGSPHVVPRLGAPAVANMYDFPTSDGLHWAILRAFSLVFTDYALVQNLYFLLTFPLAALSAFFVLRRFRVSPSAALASSLLFAFLPYHILPGEHHLFLASYYMVPWAVMLALDILNGESTVIALGANGPGRVWWRRAGPALVLCALIASSGVYYAFFAAFFLTAASIAAFLRDGNARRLVNGAALLAVISCTVIANVAPTIRYHHRYGPNPEAVVRGIGDEQFGLKIEQLLLPVDQHRVTWLAERKRAYNMHAPLVNENGMNTLGLVASLGFLFLIGVCLFWRGRGPALVDHLSLLTTSGVLLATLGGFGSLLMMALIPQIRAYNRICVFLAFFSLFAVALLVDQARRRWVRRPLAARAASCLLLGILSVGLLDQMPTMPLPGWHDYGELKSTLQNDRTFFAAVEASLPPNAMVFQLPYSPFPEPPFINGMAPYDHFRAYLNSRTLRWSYGATKGRETDRWQRAVTDPGVPVPEMLRCLRESGFSGLYINRAGYADRAGKLEAELRGLLGRSPIVSPDGQLAFYPILNAAGRGGGRA